MSVSLLLITHEDIGNALLKTARQTFTELPLAVTPVAIDTHTDPEALETKLRNFIGQLDNGHGVLILTDLFGATPCNLAVSLEEAGNVKIISGLNLPMLIKVLNYAHLPLPELAAKAVMGGKQGVIDCQICD